jgi:hypothetical protein
VCLSVKCVIFPILEPIFLLFYICFGFLFCQVLTFERLASSSICSSVSIVNWHANSWGSNILPNSSMKSSDFVFTLFFFRNDPPILNWISFRHVPFILLTNWIDAAPYNSPKIDTFPFIETFRHTNRSPFFDAKPNVFLFALSSLPFLKKLTPSPNFLRNYSSATNNNNINNNYPVVTVLSLTAFCCCRFFRFSFSKNVSKTIKNSSHITFVQKSGIPKKEWRPSIASACVYSR